MEVVCEMENRLPWVFAGELIDCEFVAGIFEFSAGLQDGIVDSHGAVDNCDDTMRRQEGDAAFQKDFAIAGDERETIITEDIEPQQGGHIDGGASRFAALYAGEVADDVGAEKEFIANHGFVGREDGLTRGIPDGAAFL